MDVLKWDGGIWVRFTKGLGVKLSPKLVTLLQTLGAVLSPNCFVKRTPELLEMLLYFTSKVYTTNAQLFFPEQYQEVHLETFTVV